MTDAKQTLAWRHVLCLLLSLSMVAAPHFSHLPWWEIALVATLIAWRDLPPRQVGEVRCGYHRQRQ